MELIRVPKHELFHRHDQIIKCVAAPIPVRPVRQRNLRPRSLHTLYKMINKYKIYETVHPTKRYAVNCEDGNVFFSCDENIASNPTGA